MSNKQPNLVYVFADQLRYDAVGFNGSDKNNTPQLDRIAGECLCLDNAVSGHPVCAPYRASLFTGKYTTSTGMVINELRINPNHRTIAHVLNDSGYETCYIGKWHLYANQLGHHYETRNSFIPEGPDRLGFNDVFAAYNFHHEYYAPKAYYHLNTPDKLPVEGYEPDYMTDYAIRQLDRLEKQDRPFALFLSLGTPHDPWNKANVPAEYYNRFKNTEFVLPDNYSSKNDPHADLWARLKKRERSELTEWMRVYCAMTANLDDNVNKIYERIKNSGLDGNTIFVFTSDHGEMFGAHGRRAKNIFYDEAVRVPFLMHWGNRVKSGRRDFVMNTVDIMPTLLGLMGLEIPDAVEGTDLSGCLLGESDNAEPALMMGTGPTAIYGNGREWRAVRDKQYTYAIYRADGREFLFDNTNDPLQKNNLVALPEYADKLSELKGKMRDKMGELGDGFLSCGEYRRRYIRSRVIQRV